MNGLLSDKLLQIERKLFQNRSMVFVKANEEYEEDKFKFVASHLKFVSKKVKESGLFGLLISVEDCFIKKEAFEKK